MAIFLQKGLLVVLACVVLQIEGFSLLRTFIINAPRRFLVDTKAKDQMFKVYWNAPTFQCKSHGVFFNDLNEEYGIRQNENDTFRGDQIAILYDPGKFPALLEDPNKEGYYYRNGGVPQEGDLDEHLGVFKKHLADLIPDEDFNGVAVIDFESWRPIFRQNFGILKPYKDVSIDIEKKKHPFWSQKSIEKEAASRFEEAGRKFMEQTLKLAKQERPLAKWGYYAFPYCFNMGKDKRPDCPKEVIDENNRIQWLWNESDLLFPSLYMNNEAWNEQDRQQMVKGRVEEAKRISSRTDGHPPIIPYFWYKYRNNEFLTKSDFSNNINQLKKSGASGVIIWGSSNDVNNKEKCLQLKEYVREVLGPVIREFTPKRTASKENDEFNSDQIFDHLF